jgi:uncharacterized membrane protein
MSDSNVIDAGSVNARAVDPGRGLGWWTDAWALFMRSALLWVVLGLILLVGLILISMVPVLGTLAASLLMPVFGGSWMLAARKVEDGGTLEVADLFSGFQGERLQPLLVVGALLLAATLVIGLVAGVIGLGAIGGMMAGGMHRSASGMFAALGAGMMALLVIMALGVLVTMALWFSTSLVVFRQVKPVDSLRLSFNAVLKNWLPFLVYSVIQLVLSFVASIPFGLGWLVLLPVTLLTAYVSYKDVFAG